MRLCLIASKPTDSVILGVLPAAARLGLEVTVLTDQPEAHERARARSALLPRPGCPRPAGSESAPGRDGPGTAASGPPVRFLGCDVWDARELIAAIAALPAPHAIASNSDHLQTQAALAASYFGLPGKDWRSALRARNKSLMRRRLAEEGAEHVASAEIRQGDDRPPSGLRYPVVLKPAEGVASEDVMLVLQPGGTRRGQRARPGPPAGRDAGRRGVPVRRAAHARNHQRRKDDLGARRFPYRAVAAAVLHRGAAHLGRTGAGRGA